MKRCRAALQPKKLRENTGAAHVKVAVEKNLVYFVGDSGGGGGGRGLNVLHTGLHALQKRRANPREIVGGT